MNVKDQEKQVLNLRQFLKKCETSDISKEVIKLFFRMEGIYEQNNR
jgi:hypothetical protein